VANDVFVIVVGGVDVGESNRIVRFVSINEGRVAALVRQARSSRRRWAGLLDVGTTLRVEWGRGRGDLRSLKTADLVRGPDRARKDLRRLAMLAYGCELISLLTPEATPAPKLFKLLSVWLDLLEEEAEPTPASRVALEAKTLAFAGIRPALRVCVSCGEAVSDPMGFDAEAGGARHQRCGPGRRIAAAELIQLAELLHTPLANTPGVPGSQTWLLSDFAQHHLGRAVNSRGLLHTLEEGL
jgi:DNA repair protein RecO (recombination protein O)